MIGARDIIQIAYEDSILDNLELLATIRNNILNGDVVVMKNVLQKDLILDIKNYLTNIGRYSLPNYELIQEGAPNHHRINRWDERSYVKCCFHQFSFFPWNQDVFDFFSITRPIFCLKNLINNQPKEKFLHIKPEDGCTARLSFQFYPKGIGGMNKHSDPVDYHQLTVPTLVMSQRGVDYETGGVFVENQDQELVFVEDICDLGDVILFNAQIPHGVKIIDEHKQPDWLSFAGRWMMIFATNKLHDNHKIKQAEDLGA